MQFLELDCDPWREQRFVELEAASTVRMPIDDADACILYPDQRWVHDKFQLTKSQGIECGSHEVEPARYPVFCKPIINRPGVGAGCCVLLNERDYRNYCAPGDFWMQYLTGEHVSIDLAVVRGDAAWCRQTLGKPDGDGTFDYWVVEDRSRPRLERHCRAWLKLNLPGYTGMVNIETIGGRLIAVHLRCADQWPDLYGRKWLDAMVGLYRHGTWDLIDNDRAEGYSVVLLGPHGSRYSYPDPHLMSAWRALIGISSIQLTVFADRPPDSQVMPPGGLRLAVINSFNLDVALRVRASMAQEFGVQGPANSRRLAG